MAYFIKYSSVPISRPLYVYYFLGKNSHTLRLLGTIRLSNWKYFQKILALKIGFTLIPIRLLGYFQDYTFMNFLKICRTIRLLPTIRQIGTLEYKQRI